MITVVRDAICGRKGLWWWGRVINEEEGGSSGRCSIDGGGDKVGGCSEEG